MIEVVGLSKYYGSLQAVKNINFSIGKGEIVGFLGPNGAGKTTTIRMLAGYLRQNSGAVKILGKDNRSDSFAIRRFIGYLPENNPLYDAMEVTEYLFFHWQARRLGSLAAGRQRVAQLIAVCGLEEVLGKELRELSKGYRQRVGLAAALIHNPPVLLLDEPTSGLDPIQAREVRQLIVSLRQEKTIILSTHILSEVQSMCTRAIIIHKGALVADRPLAELTSSDEFIVTVGFSRALNGENHLAQIEGVTGVDGPQASNDGEFSYRVRATRDIRRHVFQMAASKNLPLLELRMERKSLEEIFHELTR